MFIVQFFLCICNSFLVINCGYELKDLLFLLFDDEKMLHLC